MLDDAQRRGDILKLFARLLPQRHAYYAAARAAPFRFGQRVDTRFANEVLWQALPTVAAPRGRWRVRIIGNRWFRGNDGHRGRRREQQRLVRIETFGARPIEPTQQLVHPLLQGFAIVTFLTQCLQQLGEHAFEDDGIVGQVVQGVGVGRCGTHTCIDAGASRILHEFQGKRGIYGRAW